MTMTMNGNDESNDTFCDDTMSMSMFMDGFHWSIRHQNNDHDKSTTTCLIYLVSGWVLDDKDKFKGAMVFSFLLALLMEVLSAVRGAASHYIRRKHYPLLRFACLTIVYCLQAFLGYGLMFLAMTFSVEILGAAVMGLCLGNLAFFRYQDFQPHRRRRRQQQRHPTNGPDRGLQEPLLGPASSS